MYNRHITQTSERYIRISSFKKLSCGINRKKTSLVRVFRERMRYIDLSFATHTDIIVIDSVTIHQTLQI